MDAAACLLNLSVMSGYSNGCMFVHAAVPVQTVEWELSEANLTNRGPKYAGLTSIDLHEGDVRRFVCHVNGSFPQPQVIQLYRY